MIQIVLVVYVMVVKCEVVYIVCTVWVHVCIFPKKFTVAIHFIGLMLALILHIYVHIWIYEH